MSPTAHTTDKRAALASGTVKKRIRMCGSPAVPSTSASPSDTVSIGLERNSPGARYASGSSAFDAASLKRSGPTLTSTKIDSTIVALMSSTAFTICTHVVASMPPKMT